MKPFAWAEMNSSTACLYFVCQSAGQLCTPFMMTIAKFLISQIKKYGYRMNLKGETTLK